MIESARGILFKLFGAPGWFIELDDLFCSHLNSAQKRRWKHKIRVTGLVGFDFDKLLLATLIACVQFALKKVERVDDGIHIEAARELNKTMFALLGAQKEEIRKVDTGVFWVMDSYSAMPGFYKTRAFEGLNAASYACRAWLGSLESGKKLSYEHSYVRWCVLNAAGTATAKDLALSMIADKVLEVLENETDGKNGK